MSNETNMNGNLPAFASPGTYNPNSNQHNSDQQIGLTKREYFASIALGHAVDKWYNHSDKELVKRSIYLADELLKQLENK